MAEKRISTGLIIGAGAAAAGLAGTLIYFATRARAAPEVYTCPVCGDEFSTLEKLQYHFTMTHPREEIPIEWQ